MALKRDIAGQRTYLDTNIIIYAVEKPSPLSVGQLALFEAIDDGSITAVTSELTLAECLVYPLTANDTRLASAYEQFLTGTEIELIPIDRPILIAAAHMRALTRIKMPDAIHIATAQAAEATVFLTADRRLRVPTLNLCRWSDL